MLKMNHGSKTWPQPPQLQCSDDEIRVPFNRIKFHKYRNMNVVLAGIGLFMVLPFSVILFYSLYSALIDPKSRGDWVVIGAMYLWLVVFIGLGTIAAWQLASIQSRTLSQNLSAIVIDQQGIQDNVSNYVLGRIAWSEIESVFISSRYSPKLNKTFPGVTIVLKDKNMILRKKSKIVAIWMQADDEITKKCQVLIPQGRLDVPVEDVVLQINQFRTRLNL